MSDRDEARETAEQLRYLSLPDQNGIYSPHAVLFNKAARLLSTPTPQAGDAVREAASSIDQHQRRGAALDIIDMLDDDYDAHRALNEIIARMDYRRSALSLPPSSPAGQWPRVPSAVQARDEEGPRLPQMIANARASRENAATQSTPDGEWQWVPKEPTEQMARRFYSAHCDHSFALGYRAMLAAAPRPATGGGGAGRAQSNDS